MHRQLQRWLIDVPALIVTIWYRMYVVFMAVTSIVTIGMLFIVLTLWFGFGIRWGW